MEVRLFVTIVLLGQWVTLKKNARGGGEKQRHSFSRIYCSNCLRESVSAAGISSTPGMFIYLHLAVRLQTSRTDWSREAAGGEVRKYKRIGLLAEKDLVGGSRQP